MAVAQAVGARLWGLTEEDSVLLEAMVPTARLPVPPPRKAPALGRPPPWDGGEESHGSPSSCAGHVSVPWGRWVGAIGVPKVRGSCGRA